MITAAHMNRAASLPLIFTFAAAAACTQESTAPVYADAQQSSEALPWPARDAPGQLLPGISTLLRDVVQAKDVGNTFMVQANRMPFSNTYWPFIDNGIDDDWSGQGSPLSKYMRFFDSSSEQSARAWEQTQHGSALPDVQDWFGHCNGWSAAATSVAPPLHAVNVRIEGGTVLSCADGDPRCTRFEVSDIHALLTEVYLDGPQRVLGDRCEVAPGDIARDGSGRITSPGCGGVNAGTFMSVLARRIKNDALPFVMAVQSPNTTNQIWNQPVAGYTVYGYRPLSRSQAVGLVGAGVTRSYDWNPAARGWVRVDVGVRYVVETHPTMSPFSGASAWDELRFSAVLELTGPTVQSSTRVLGGEYLDLPALGANRLRVAPFVWIAAGTGPAVVKNPSTSTHNPWLNPTLVTFLASESRK